MSELDIEERMRRMEYAVFGLADDNGLRAEVRGLRLDLRELRADLGKRREQEREHADERRELDAVDRKADRRVMIQILAGFGIALLTSLFALAQAGVFG